jgi:hypothetical protein
VAKAPSRSRGGYTVETRTSNERTRARSKTFESPFGSALLCAQARRWLDVRRLAALDCESAWKVHAQGHREL